MDKPKKYRSASLDAMRAMKDPLQTQRVRMSMMLAAKIAEGIKNQGFSKGGFAEVMKKKQSVISRWLSGTHNFTSDTLSDIQQVLGIRLLAAEEIKQRTLISETVYGSLAKVESPSLIDTHIRDLCVMAVENGGRSESYTASREKISNRDVQTIQDLT
jgi:ribosome-binding protein aMBF1 (putative translation factor)